MTSVDYLFYHLWSEKNISTILNDIETKTPRNIVIFGPEEWEVGNLFKNNEFLIELESKLKSNDIKLYLIFGSGDKEFYKSYFAIPKVNTTVILWPMFWVYFTHYSLNNYNPNIIESYKCNNIDKLFISLNNKSLEHRCQFMDELVNNNLLDNGYVSWMEPNVNYDWKFWTPKKLILDDEYPNNLNSYSTIPNEYGRTLLNVVTESTMNVPFITEKTFTCVFLNKPFIILGAHGIHKLLVEYGFELYDELFDYSFDMLIETEDRIKGIIDNLKNLKDKSYDELSIKVRDKIKRNKMNAFEIIKNKKYIPEYVSLIGEQFKDDLNEYIFTKFI